MFILYFIFLLLLVYQIRNNPSCTLKLTCKKECDSLKVGSISISMNPISTTESNIQYRNANFPCQPGDEITFTLKVIETVNAPLPSTFDGGFIGSLNIKGDGESVGIDYNSYDLGDLNIFSCNPICTPSTTDQLHFEDTPSNEHNSQKYTESLSTTITIKIPYEVIMKSPSPSPFINIKSSKDFDFSQFIDPKVPGADTSRISVKITEISNGDYVKLFRNPNEDDIVQNDEEITLSQQLTLKVQNDDYYGKFIMKYNILTMGNDISVDNTIIFNICYKYCSTCDLYDSFMPVNKKCTQCMIDSALSDDEKTFFVPDVEPDKCFPKNEIAQNYYQYSPNTYKPCNNYCATCVNNQNECLTCNKEELFYFFEDKPSGSSSDHKKCFLFQETNGVDGIYYYLNNPPDGVEYKKCPSPCKECKMSPDSTDPINPIINCFSCVTGFNFYPEVNPNACQNLGITNYFLVQTGFYLKNDEICDTKGDHISKRKCDTCKNGYYNYQDDDYCYLPEEIISKYGINTYKFDATHYKNCPEECRTCLSETNCLKCIEGYYFFEGSPGVCKIENDIKNLEITDGTNKIKYYLPSGSETYYKCDANCVCEYEKDNCISCINNYYLVEDEKKCEQGPLKNGYYPDNTNKIFRKCHISCLTCDGGSPNKCLSCAEPYHLITINSDTKRCITQIEKKNNSEYDNYYLNSDGNYYKCHSNCSKCEDEDGGEKCNKCSNGYYFKEDDDNHNCFKNDIYFFNENENYYFNTNLSELRKCHKSCKSCKDGTVYNNCYECYTDSSDPDNPDKNYAFIDDPYRGKCVKKKLFETTLANYYKIKVENHPIRSGSIDVFVYQKCPDNCTICNSFEENPLKCQICNMDKGYYKHTESFNDNAQEECYNNSIIKHRYFSGSGYSPSNSECLISTYETQEKQSCIQCHNKYGFYSLEHDKTTCHNVIPEDHYLTTNNIIKKCPYECASCHEEPTTDSTNCDICKEEFLPSNTNPKNCIFKCDFYQYKYLDNKYCTGEKECPDNLAPYLIEENSTCVQKCEKFSYYGKCLDICPENTNPNGQNICKDLANKCILTKSGEIREHLVDIKKDSSPISKKVKKYRKYFDNTYSHVDMYTHYLNEYIMLIYQYNECIKELLPDFISIDFSPCDSFSSVTRGEYIIVLFLVPRENKYSQTYYLLYKTDNLNSPTTVCNNDDIILEIPAKQANFDIDKYQKLKNKGIDLTDANENFFHDMCFQNYEDGKDIVIEQRRKEYYQDKYKICIDNCEWETPNNLNFKYKRAQCRCSSVNHLINKVNVDYYDHNKARVMSDDFYKTDIFIFEHLKCFKYNFERGKLVENGGSYMIIVCFVFEIISVIVYCVFGIDSIKIYIIDFVKRNPPPRKSQNSNSTGSNKDKNSENNSNSNDIKSISINRNTSINFMEDNNQNKKSNKQIINNNFIEEKSKTIKSYKKSKKWEKPDLLVGRSNNLGIPNIQNKNVKIYERLTKKEEIEEIEENKNIQEEIQNNNKQPTKRSLLFSSKIILKNESTDKDNKAFKKHKHVFTDYELNSMELYDALIKDKRDFCYFYKLQIKAKQELYRAFRINEPLYPISIKIIIYVFNLSLSLVFNALLYTEDQIYEGIKSVGKSIGYLFLRSFYTFLIIKVIDYLINLFVKNANYLRSLVYRRKREKEIRVDAYKSLKHVEANYCFFIIFVIICDGLFWIFISSYCYCYNGEQVELFCSVLVTQFYMEIYCIIFGLYLAVFRYIGMKYKDITCYKMSQTFLDN